MELLIRLFAALRLDILANDFFIPMTPDGTDKVAFRPEFPAPSLLLDRGDSCKHFASRHAFADPHHLGGTVGGDRLHEKVHMIVIRTNFQEHHCLPFGAVQTDLFEHRINTGVEHDAAIFCRTDQMLHQDGDMVALMDIFAHTSDNNGSKQAKQASGNLTPRD